MHLSPFVLLLAATCCCAANVRGGRVPITFNTSSEELKKNDSEMALNLPQGFNPEPRPMNPLLYPFATGTPMAAGPPLVPVWRPIPEEIEPTAKPQSTTIPLLQDRISQVTEAGGGGPPFESIVYGTWKPDPPVQPEEIFHQSQKSQDTGVAVENVAKHRNASPLELMLNGQHVSDAIFLEQSDEMYHTSEKPEEPTTEHSKFLDELSEQRKRDSEHDTAASKKYGRKKIPPIENKAFQHKTGIGSAVEVIMVSSSHPAILERAKQINDSIETTRRPRPLKRKTTERSTWVPILPTEAVNSKEENVPLATNASATDSIKVWPTDFNLSNDQSSIETLKLPSDYNFDGDSSAPPQALSGFKIPESLLPPLNITKMGVPYENQSSVEESSICVPMTVREKSVLDDMQIVDVERVYCFPLPMSEIKGLTGLNGSEAKVKTLDEYVKIHSESSSVRVEHCCLLTFLCYFLLRFHLIYE